MSKKARKMYVLVINSHQTDLAEDITTLVSTSPNELINYVIEEELPEQGYSPEDIDEMGAVESLEDEWFWTDPEGVDYFINESTLI